MPLPLRRIGRRGGNACKSTGKRCWTDGAACRFPTAPRILPRIECVTSDVVVDSCVAVKWVISEADSAQADRIRQEVPAKGGRLIGLDLAFNEVANAIWKR